MELNLKEFTISDFKSRTGELFSLPAEDGELMLRLDEVQSRGVAERQGGAFSLLFSGPREPLLQQAIHRLRDCQSNTMDMFLVPVNQTEDASFYEAVFS